MKTGTKPNNNNYIKYTYFVPEEKFRDFKQWTKEQHIPLVKAKHKACEVLHPRVQAGFVAPKVWNRDCPRQGAWHRESSASGNYLIAGTVPFDQMDKGTRLTLSDFTPPALPTNQELDDLVRSTGYLQQKPQEWEHITEDDRLKFAMGRKTIKQTLGEVPAQANESFDDVFVSHCANHSNIIDPLFFVEEGGQICPYSISDTFHVCSACLELFNLVGREHRIKYVVPCPGAVTAAELPIHRYIRVDTIP